MCSYLMYTPNLQTRITQVPWSLLAVSLLLRYGLVSLEQSDWEAFKLLTIEFRQN